MRMEGDRTNEGGMSLKESEAKLRALLNAVTETALLLDTKGIVLAVNDATAERLGVDQGRIEGRSVFDFFAPQIAKSRVAAFEKAIEGGKPVRTEDTRKGRIYDTHWYPILGEDRKVKQVAVFAADITEKRKMEDARLRAEKLESLAVLAGGIAHDFNNLLSVIIGYIDLARMDARPGGPIAENLASAMETGMRARKLTEEFLMLSKGTSPNKKAGSIGKVLKSSLEIALAGSSVRSECVIASDLRPVHIDESQMRQVFARLLTNAREALADEGMVMVRAENLEHERAGTGLYLPLEVGAYVKVTIRDNGKGIPRSHLPRVFDPYFSTKQRGSQKGVGLGLAVAQSIISKHGGYIQIESHEGAGTMVSVYLPALDGTGREAAS